jgi:hypothetical protein
MGLGGGDFVQTEIVGFNTFNEWKTTNFQNIF